LVVDKSNNDRDVPHDYVELRQPLRARYLKVENLHMPSGNFCLSDLRVFGIAEGEAPTAVKGFKVVRDKKDMRNCMITWKPSERAYGYNIRYGIAPDKLYHCITVNGECEYDLRGLDLGTDYYFAIEALGETGCSEMSKILKQ
ncbi:MAG: fibronectin type III domain-containing protein, partial [Muribaculaceae bacterium]